MAKYFSGVMNRESTESEIGHDITNKFSRWYMELADMRMKALQFENYDRGIPQALPEWSHPDAPNYFVPYIETLVDTIVAKFFLTLFAHDPIIRYKPISRESILATAITERIVHYYLNHRTPDMMSNLYLWVKDAVLQGYGVMLVYWDKFAMGKSEIEPSDPDPMMDEMFGNSSSDVSESYAPEEGNKGPKPSSVETTESSVSDIEGEGAVEISPEKEPEYTQSADSEAADPNVKKVFKPNQSYEGFQFKVLDIEDVATDFNEPNYRKVPVIVREYIQPEEYFNRVEQLGWPEISEEDLEDYIIYYDGPRILKQTAQDRRIYTRPKLEILHYYGKGYESDAEGEELQDMKITILRHSYVGTNADIDKHVILERTAIGFKPVCILRFKPLKNNFGGRGVGDMCFDLQTELNISYNSRLMNMAMSLHRMFIVDSQANIKDMKSALISRPGGVIVTDNIEGVKELEHKPLSPDAFNFTRETIGYMQNVTAAQDIIMGQSQRQELATTATIMDNNAKQRLELHIFRMAKEAVQQLGDLLRTMMLELYDPDDKIEAILTHDEMANYADKLTSPDGKQLVDPSGFMEVQVKDMQGAMYADTEVSAADGDKRSVRQEMLQLLQTVRSFDPQGMGIPTGRVTEDGKMQEVEKLNITKAIKELFRLWGRVDVSDFVQTLLVPVPQQPMQQQGPGNMQQQPELTGEPIGAQGAPPASEMYNMMASADHHLATGG